MEDQVVDFTKPPPEPEYPIVDRSVPRCILLRQAGFTQKTSTPPPELQWAAEDKMVLRKHEEFKCHLPDVSRSTFLMVFSPDGKKVASTHGNHNVYVTDLTSGKNIKTLSGHPRTPWCIAFHPSSNQILASGCLGGQVRVWDLSGGSEIWMAESQTVIASLAFHPIDRMLVIASYNELHFWDWSQPEPFAKCFTANEKEKVRYVAFDALGHKLITGVANAPARHASQWDRVAAPQPSPQASQLESERRITICYRYMVEQYEQLVQRYRDLTRARSTLTMDRGTDPMEFEGESSDSQNTAQNASRLPRSRGARTSFLVTPPRPRQSSGTDEISASHSSTNFLTPPEPSQSEDIPPVTQPLLSTTPAESSPDVNQPNSPINRADTSRRNPRFDITLPSFSSFRSRSSSIPTHPHTSSSPYNPIGFCSRHQQDPDWPGYLPGTPLARFTLSPDAVNFNWSPSAQTRQNNQTESGQNPLTENNSPSTPNNAPNRPPGRGETVQQIVRNLMSSWYNRNEPSGEGTSTEVNSAVESEEQEPNQRLQSESHTEDEEPREQLKATAYILPPTSRTQSVFRNADVDSETDELDDLRGFQASNQQPQNDEEALNNLVAAAVGPPDELEPPTLPVSPPSHASRASRGSDSSARRFSEASAVSQLRSQFHRLQSVYENRNSGSNSHVFSPESQACERRLLNRINEILDRPLPEPRTRRLFASRRSAFQSRPPPPAGPTTSSGTTSATSPDIIGGVQYGIQLLSQHIDNMQRLCRARLEILQLQQIRRMWEDLQSQIYALHGAVRDGRGDGETQEAPPRPAASTSADLLTDDDSDGPSNNGEIHWRMRRTPQTSRRNLVKTPLPRTPNRNPPMKRSRLTLRPNDYGRRLSMLQMETNRRQLNRQASSSTQATSEERGEASSSHVSGDTSTGTGTGSDERGSVRGVKRKSRDPDSLFRPRPSTGQGQGTSGTGGSAGAGAGAGTSPGGAGPSTSSLAAMMRDTIVQLENMVWRHRQSNSQRNTRLSRFTRQREERMMRNLWDTESSHESGRDDQSEGDSTSQSEQAGADTGDTEWTRDTTRMRARQVLLLMVDSLTQFFENDNLIRRSTNEALNDRIQDLYVLLQLALNLTDLLLAQLVHSRRELEARRPNMIDHPPNNWMLWRSTRHARHSVNRQIRRTSLAWRRILRRAAPATSPSTSPPPSPDQPRRPPTIAQPPPPAPPNRHYMMNRPHSVYYNLRSAMLSHYQPHNQLRPLGPVPIVRVNDLPPPPPEANMSRFRPHSPPPMGPHPMFPRFLHPGRYPGGGFVFDESTSEDSSPHDRSGDFFFMRAGYGSSSVILTDTPMSPHHRIQAWDFSKYKLPDLGNADKNIVVGECKIHNDASVDMSKDGRLLVTLLPSGRLSMTTLLGIYSLQWETLGQLLYTTSFEQSIVSVSLSPTSRHLVVGLASRRIALVSADRHTNAQIFRLEGAKPGQKAPLTTRGRLVHLRDLELSRHLGFMSLNCIRWAPNPGQGLVYGTNTGQLKILR